MAKRGIKPHDGIRRPYDMTKNQYEFAILILKGMTQWQAYLQAYDPTVSKKDAETRGHNVAKTKKVQLFLNEKRQKELEIKNIEEKAVWEWNDALHFLTDVASGKHKEKRYGHGGYVQEREVDTRTRLKAVEIMANLWKMSIDIQQDREATVTVNVINEANNIHKSLESKMTEDGEYIDVIPEEDVIDISDVQGELEEGE